MHPHKNKNWWRRLDPLTALLLLLLALGILVILAAALVHVRSGEREQNRTYDGARSAMNTKRLDVRISRSRNCERATWH